MSSDPKDTRVRDMRRYSIHDYQTGRELGGQATDDLLAASRSEPSGTGAALAFCVEGVWDYVREDDRARYVARGFDVVTVYIVEHEHPDMVGCDACEWRGDADDTVIVRTKPAVLCLHRACADRAIARGWAQEAP